MTPTVLVTPVELDVADLVVEGDAYRHLFRAARAARGDAVRAVDGRGRARWGEVVRVESRRAVVRLGAAGPSLEPRIGVELLVGAPRPSRASWLVEKGTELGVRAFRFLACERAQRELDAAALERLRRVARAAVEQCGRSWLPEVTAARGIEEAIGELGGLDGAAAFVLDPAADAEPQWLAGGSAERAVLLIGPEGGFTPAEIDAASRLGAAPMRLVPSLLRVETAALAAAAWVLLQGECSGARF
ncbi:MAG TPA: RsmE family RNA methyltransferase [Thermoanaerobaculia bacterium]|nr:RsmE family RNA methyltransferase [Thermoanaerobaculia bacterium]